MTEIEKENEKERDWKRQRSKTDAEGETGEKNTIKGRKRTREVGGCGEAGRAGGGSRGSSNKEVPGKGAV